MMIPGKYRVIEPTLDLVTPPDVMPAGRAIAAKNYEPVKRGASRFSGYERYDGQPKPSDQSYWILNFDAGTAAISAAQTVTGQTSGATGIAVLAGIVSSGSYGGGNAAGYLVLRQVSGTFQDNENLQVSAVTKCAANGTAAERNASTDALDATYLQAAIEAARALIAKPTGSGRVRGVWKYKGVRYCFRDNAGGTAGGMFKSSSTGWTAVDLGRRVAFTSGGTFEVSEGDVITGATSAATATVRRIIITSGDWTTGDAAGWLVLYGQTGTFQSENLNVGANLNVASIGGNSAAQTLTAGGTYRFVTHNFYGASNRRRMYFVNGVNAAMDFDGDYFALIPTTMTTDTPTHVAVYKNQLVLAFPGGSVQTQAVGEPYTSNVLLGTSELGLGADVTNLLSNFSDNLAITGRTQLKLLYGNDSDDFTLDDTNGYAGAYQDTLQLTGVPVYLDDTGIRKLTPTDAAFGNFSIGTLSEQVEPFLKDKREAGTSPTCSIVCKRKDQYRLFFDDGDALFVSFARKTRERLPCILPITFDHVVRNVCAEICSTGEDANEEVILFGTDDGWVMEMDVGTSFDGEEVQAHFRTAFDNDGKPNQRKQYKLTVLKADAAPTATLNCSAEFSGGDPDQPPVPETEFDI